MTAIYAIALAVSAHVYAVAACGGSDSSEGLPRFTPMQSDWSPTCENVDDHTPPASVAWDKTTIYNPVTSLDLDTPRDESAFYNQMCPKNSEGKNRLRGLRQLFDEVKPFADNKKPAKAEVDRWNGIVLTHIRKLAGIDHVAKPDVCLMTRALWANQWRHTDIWSLSDSTTPDRYVCPKSGSNMHCGASFVPNTYEKQKPYLPKDHAQCSATAGSEGAFGHSKNSAWSAKTAEVFCGTLKAEGYWGGHTGPFWGREKFGFGFWHDGSARFKWGGVSKASIYQDPRSDMFTMLDGLDATCETKVCDGLFWPGAQFDTAQQCREYALDNPDCSNTFFTYNQGNRGCGCYPPSKTECGTVSGQASRNTFFLSSVDEGSQNLGPSPVGCSSDGFPARACGAPPTSLLRLMAGKTAATSCSSWMGSTVCKTECFEEIPYCGEEREQSGGYIGCFKDDNKRDLDRSLGRNPSEGYGADPEGQCRALCDNEGFTYFALQSPSSNNNPECKCGNAYSTSAAYSQIDDSNCAFNSQQWGGGWKNAVYEVAPDNRVAQAIDVCGVCGGDGSSCTDPCTSMDCGNGDCINGGKEIFCECTAGWDGADCKNNIDDCQGQDCGNGECKDGVDTHTCECTAGWDGADCKNNIDDCTCTEQYEPVCGADDKTYDNACKAKCAQGFTDEEIEDGECEVDYEVDQCECAAEWTSPEDGEGCATTQEGCTQCEADEDAWCMCADETHWSYCTVDNDCAVATKEMADELAAEKLKQVELASRIASLKIQLAAASTCKAYTQKGRRAVPFSP